MSAVSGHLLYYVRSLWSSPVLCPQSLVISCTMSAVSGHLLYSCTMSAVSGHPCTMSTVSGHPCTVRSLWSSPVLCPQSLVISCTMVSIYEPAVIDRCSVLRHSRRTQFSCECSL
ncbi:unnamed protein product [Staurois parvus]|uniref:Uncharacterized protein n=1 Tax=Staurois parvus TaxID=386267 RepID=A0ABN9F4K3_9NEOB|nr:unnamed protein product [Staurois parvus]